MKTTGFMMLYLRYILCTMLLAGAVICPVATWSEPLPHWTAQPKSSDGMYLYYLGSAKAASRREARDAAWQSVISQISRMLSPDSPGSVPVRRAEILPGCLFFREVSGEWECWMQVSYPVTEKNRALNEARAPKRRFGRPIRQPERPPQPEQDNRDDSANTGNTPPAGQPAGTDASGESRNTASSGNRPPANPAPGQEQTGRDTAGAGSQQKADAAPDTLVPGPVVAEADIGPSGGTIRAPGLVSVEFPSGSLPSMKHVIIRKPMRETEGQASFLVEYEGSSSSMLGVPARITFILPQGCNADQAFVTQEILPGMRLVANSSVEDGGRTVTAEVTHFSWSECIWSDEACRIYSRVSGAVGGTVVGGAVVVLTGVAGAGVALTTGPALLAGAIIVTFATSGWVLGDEAYQAYKMAGLEGPIPFTGFNILWDPRPFQQPSADNRMVTAVIDRNGKFMGYLRDDRPTTIGPDDGQSSSTRPLVRHVRVPIKIIELAGKLQEVRTWYRNYMLNDDMPTIEVAVHTDLPVLPQTGEKAAGLWSGSTFQKALNINVAKLTARGDVLDQDLLSTIAHEYWHAICTKKGYGELFPGAEECMATTFESIIFPFKKEYPGCFLVLHQWVDEVAPVLGNGLATPGPGEGSLDAVTRGYALWPFGKYMAHRHGSAALQGIARQTLDQETMTLRFESFVMSIITAQKALDNPASHVVVDIPSVTRAITGWEGLDLSAIARRIEIKPGKHANIGPASLYSLRVMQIELPELAANEQPAPFIVRRPQNCAHETLFLLPTRPMNFRGDHRAEKEEDLRRSTGMLVVKEGLATAGAGTKTPLAIMASTPGSFFEAKGQDNPLLVYQLLPPTQLALNPKKDDSSTKVLSWELPALGDGLTPADCLSGYQILSKTRNNDITIVADIKFKSPDNPNPYPEGETGRPVVYIDPNASQTEIPASWLERVPILGMANIDAAAGDEQTEQLLVSPPAWMIEQGMQWVLTSVEKKDFPAGNYWQKAMTETSVGETCITCKWTQASCNTEVVMSWSTPPATVQVGDSCVITLNASQKLIVIKGQEEEFAKTKEYMENGNHLRAISDPLANDEIDLTGNGSKPAGFRMPVDAEAGAKRAIMIEYAVDTRYAKGLTLSRPGGQSLDNNLPCGRRIIEYTLTPIQAGGGAQ